MTKSKLTNRFYFLRSSVFFILVCVLPAVYSPRVNAQLKGQEKLDSLLSELPKAKEDSNKVKLLYQLTGSTISNNYEQALLYAKQSLALSEKLKDNSIISSSNYFLGNVYSSHSDYGKALDAYYTALRIEQARGDKEGLASLYNNIAVSYLSLGDHAKAIDANLKALKFFEEVNNQYGMANCHINIGSVYGSIEEDAKALSHYEQAYKIYTAISDKRGIALSLNNIGAIDIKTNDYIKARDAFIKALAIYEEIKYAEGIDMANVNIAESYHKTFEYKEALDYAFKALAVAKASDSPEGMAYDYKAISEIYYGMASEGDGNNLHTNAMTDRSTALKRASLYADSAIAICKETGMLEEYASTAELLSKIHFASGRFKEAYESHLLFKSLNDSVFNLEKDKKITQSAMQYDFDKKEASIKAEQEKKNIRQRNIRNSIIAGLLGSLVFLIVVYRQRNRISKEKARSEELLLNILPEEVAEELKEKGSADAKHFAEVTVMFTDFKGFTQISEKLTPAELVAEIHTCFKAFDQIITKYNIEKIKTIGDAYMCAGGLPVANTNNAVDVVDAALEIQQFMQAHLLQRKQDNKEPFEIRIGIHTGPVVAGIVGVKKFAYDIWGDTVNTASRMESSGEAGKVNISGSTYALVKDTFRCTHRGKVLAKGKGEVDMYFVEGRL